MGPDTDDDRVYGFFVRDGVGAGQSAAGVPVAAAAGGCGGRSVVWWHYTETIGRGDLRLYFWVQFYPMLAVGLLLWLFYDPGIKPVLRTLVWIVVWYVVAKVFEFLDYPIYDAIGVSGHTLKHLAAAVSTGYFVRIFRRNIELGVCGHY